MSACICLYMHRHYIFLVSDLQTLLFCAVWKIIFLPIAIFWNIFPYCLLALEDRLFCLFDKDSILQSQNLGNWSPHFISIAITAWVILDPALCSILWLIHLMTYINGQMIVAVRDRSWCISCWWDKIWCNPNIAGRFKWGRCLCFKQNWSLHFPKT